MVLTQKEIEEAQVQLCQPYMSQQQQEDCERLIAAADDMAAAAAAFNSGGTMGYTSFIQSRDHFREVVASTWKNYRVVVGR